MNIHSFRPSGDKAGNLFDDGIDEVCVRCSRPSSDPVHPQPPPQVRLYTCDPYEEEGYFLSMDEAIRRYVEYAGFRGSTCEVAEFSVTDNHEFLPNRFDFDNWLEERSEDLEVVEGWYEAATDALEAPEVRAAYDAFIDLLASRIKFHMAEERIATYAVEITRDMQGTMTGWRMR